jgi:deoxyribodipyrimidine photo-lyase
VPASAPAAAPARIASATLLQGLELPEPGGIALPEPGEGAARAALGRFVRDRLARYKDARDRMDVESTSRLSYYTRFGLVSPRQIQAAVGAAVRRDRRLASPADTFMRELAWREFFVQILGHVPASLRADLREDRRGIPWRRDLAALRAWQEGRTGYPVVDAGMRELAATGFMHNRARLVTASFLTKHLLIDWRERALVHAPPAGRRSRRQRGELAVGGLHRGRRHARLPDLQPALQGPASIRRATTCAGGSRNWRGSRDPTFTPRGVRGVSGYPSPIVAHEEARTRALAVLARATRISQHQLLRMGAQIDLVGEVGHAEAAVRCRMRGRDDKRHQLATILLDDLGESPPARPGKALA